MEEAKRIIRSTTWNARNEMASLPSVSDFHEKFVQQMSKRFDAAQQVQAMGQGNGQSPDQTIDRDALDTGESNAKAVDSFIGSGKRCLEFGGIRKF